MKPLTFVFAAIFCLNPFAFATGHDSLELSLLGKGSKVTFNKEILISPGQGHIAFSMCTMTFAILDQTRKFTTAHSLVLREASSRKYSAWVDDTDKCYYNEEEKKNICEDVYRTVAEYELSFEVFKNGKSNGSYVSFTCVNESGFGSLDIGDFRRELSYHDLSLSSKADVVDF